MGLPDETKFTIIEVRQIATRVAMRRGVEFDPMLIADIEDVIADVILESVREGL